MKLWLVKNIEDLPRDDNPWLATYDCSYGFVIRAVSETDARRAAQSYKGDEGKTQKPWLSDKYSTCEELKQSGRPGLILQDFLAG